MGQWSNHVEACVDLAPSSRFSAKNDEGKETDWTEQDTEMTEQEDEERARNTPDCDDENCYPGDVDAEAQEASDRQHDQADHRVDDEWLDDFDDCVGTENNGGDEDEQSDFERGDHRIGRYAGNGKMPSVVRAGFDRIHPTFDRPYRAVLRIEILLLKTNLH